MFVCFSEEQTQQKEVEEEEEALTGKDEEERRIAEMGRPMLGDHVKLEVIIEESYEFKVRLVFLFFFGYRVCDDKTWTFSAKCVNCVAEYTF